MKQKINYEERLYQITLETRRALEAVERGWPPDLHFKKIEELAKYGWVGTRRVVKYFTTVAALFMFFVFMICACGMLGSFVDGKWLVSFLYGVACCFSLPAGFFLSSTAERM